ncbi:MULTISPECIES: 2Fe-2S iron-sulfur cluster-binding protein [Paenibacillus]|uniref:2Fe-2S iron-sulfur cluster binding domain-containing protein n=1 Tax=Paenibacillus campinasensis TaxID=66347 RepID=A0A268F2U4_9BACL|nr:MULTISPECIES: 2Fe-2S iron-sulfur cluster-binding protein [Paenibacillus]MUG64991.1 2Fe-2S iron-sulfur cluster binding domain-containing protein [Paenibacillus campinasensis]PAD79706.1 ferredoxin [Paenibacillus campinasensis]PAK53569.1 ferredoxin [Paenibacillus sp. 7541]
MSYEITFLPDGKTITVRPYTTVLDAAKKAGVRIPTRCGGKAGCLMCKVTIEESERANCLPPEDKERRKLGAALLERGSRLSCQTKVTGPLTVVVPEDPLKAAVRKQLEAAKQRESDDWI